MAKRQPSLTRGAAIGRYEVDAFLGAGGMGEVYVARDRTLDRRVAVKIVPRDCSQDRIVRFQREAQASSALNHPAIVSVYDAGCADGIHFLAMELIDGEPLSAWITSRRNTRRGIELMAQVADGLARAHAAAIVHRDLKPDNIMVAREGYAKIVDFGVAKLKEPSIEASAPTDIKTASGSLVGTASYMSPEQVSAQDVDYRSDIFSFGAVLFEVLTGSRPFAGETSIEVMHAIRHDEPKLDGLPLLLRRIVRRCLAKEPESRYQSMKDVALDLREAAEPQQESVAGSRAPLWVAIVLVIIGVIVAILWPALRRPARVPAAHPSATMARITNSGNVTSVAITPDGKFVVYAMREGDNQGLWVKQLSTGTATRITDAAPIAVQRMQVSPDGNYVYYTASHRSNTNVGYVYQVPILGGEPRRIASDTEFGFTIAPDGKRVAFRRFNTAERIQRLTIADVETGTERVLLARRSPSTMLGFTWFPDGSKITFLSGSAAKQERMIEEVSVADAAVSVVRRSPWDTRTATMTWLPDGSALLVSASEKELPPQVWTLPLRGEPTRVTSDVSSYFTTSPTADGRQFAALRGEGTPSLAVLRIAPDGTATPIAAGLGNNFSASGMQSTSVMTNSFVATRGVSWLDSEHLLYTGVINGTPTILSVPISGAEPRVLIRGMSAWSATPTRDGQHIVFVSDQSGISEAWVANADGTNARQLTKAGGVANPTPTADGRFVYYTTVSGGQVMHRIPIDGGEAPPILKAPSRMSVPSADGKLLLCRLRSQLPNGQAEWRTVIVDSNSGKVVREVRLPRSGGTQIRWHPSGRSIVAVDTTGGVDNLWEEPIDGGPLRQITSYTRGAIYSFDYSPDGKSIAVLQGEPRNDVVIISDFR